MEESVCLGEKSCQTCHERLASGDLVYVTLGKGLSDSRFELNRVHWHKMGDVYCAECGKKAERRTRQCLYVGVSCTSCGRPLKKGERIWTNTGRRKYCQNCYENKIHLDVPDCEGEDAELDTFFEEGE